MLRLLNMKLMTLVALSAGTTTVLGVGSLAYIAKRHDITFDHLRDAKSALVAAGYHCTSDCANGRLSSGFLLSREDVSWSDASKLCKVGVMGPEWKGKVWVTLSPDYWQLQSIP